LCNEWLQIIHDSKNNDVLRALFLIKVTMQLFVRRDFESSKFVQIMQDLAFCMEKRLDLDEDHFKILLTALQGIQMKNLVCFLPLFSLVFIT